MGKVINFPTGPHKGQVEMVGQVLPLGTVHTHLADVQKGDVIKISEAVLKTMEEDFLGDPSQDGVFMERIDRERALELVIVEGANPETVAAEERHEGVPAHAELLYFQILNGPYANDVMSYWVWE